MFSFLRPSIKQSTEPLGEFIVDGLISDLKEKYKKRIESKLAGRFPVNLRITASHTGTSEETAQNFITIQDEEVGSEIGEIFDRAHGRLLVLGLPGAGKTTMLLQLAVELLKRAETVPFTMVAGTPGAKAAGTATRPIPILLNLITWRSEFATFDEWLWRILPNELGASKALVEKIYTKTPLILLLDGLDEVPEEDRYSCLEALGQYGLKPEYQFVISSRVNEYATTKDAPVYSQVEVTPLTAKQVELNLIAYAGLTPEAKPLLNAIQRDPLLKQAIENPFYLNTAQLLFASGKNWSEFGFAATDLVGRQKELVQRFVEDALRHTVKHGYPAEKVKKWLEFLARKLEEEKLRVFELVDLKPEWRKKGWQYKLTEFFTQMLFGGSILGLIVLLILKYRHFTSANEIEMTYDSGIGTTLTVTFCLSIFLMNFLYISPVLVKEEMKWSWRKVKKPILFEDILSLAQVAIFCLSVLFLLIFLKWYIMSGIFVFALLAIAAQGIRELFLKGISFENSLKIQYPYQRFTKSIKLLNFSLLDHISLRVVLWIQSSLPLRLVPFLNEMSRRHLLEFDGNLDTETGGGTWRWRHRIIQEYFLATKTTTAKNDN